MLYLQKKMFNNFLISKIQQPISPLKLPTNSTSSPIKENGTTVLLQASSKESVAEAYAEKLRNEPDIQAALQPEVLDRNPDEALRKAVLFPLLEIDAPKDCLLLVVDSIDEGPIPGSGVLQVIYLRFLLSLFV